MGECLQEWAREILTTEHTELTEASEEKKLCALGVLSGEKGEEEIFLADHLSGLVPDEITESVTGSRESFTRLGKSLIDYSSGHKIISLNPVTYCVRALEQAMTCSK